VVLFHQLDGLIGAMFSQKVTIRVDGVISECLGQSAALLKRQNMTDGSAMGAVGVRRCIGHIQRPEPSAPGIHA
jgi:hypothetical protein